jgi:hypothetical protein
MNSVKYLYAAYTATWLIHLFYIGTLLLRYAKLRERKSESGKHRP